MGATHISLCARLQCNQLLGKLTEFDHHQRKRVIGKSGEWLLAEAGNPQENKFSRLYVQFLIECQDRNIVGDFFITDQGDRTESHVYIVLHQRFGAVAGHLICTALEICRQHLKVIFYFVGSHTDQGRTHTENTGAHGLIGPCIIRTAYASAANNGHVDALCNLANTFETDG